jgi:uncharacterized protein YuzE
MNIQYDSKVDAAYIQIVELIEPGMVASTYLCDPAEVGGMINLDFDANGRLLGIEVIGASTLLSEKVLKEDSRPPIPRG